MLQSKEIIVLAGVCYILVAFLFWRLKTKYKLLYFLSGVTVLILNTFENSNLNTLLILIQLVFPKFVFCHNSKDLLKEKQKNLKKENI